LGQSALTAGPVTWGLATVSDTVRLGAALAHHCPWSTRGPRLLFLSGDLGTGKTTLAAALLAALGVEEPVRSPTYALIEEYPIGNGLAVHVDLYRLRGADELAPLGLQDHLVDQTLLIVEWPERAAAALPRPDLMLTLAVKGEGRLCRAEAHTIAGASWLAQSAAEMACMSPPGYVQPDTV
jgi:tRNA threonylcarbamoyl adenosine modification protein YjeE